jgi:pimeloyl-ACP methyl ester carboxylesterase
MSIRAEGDDGAGAHTGPATTNPAGFISRWSTAKSLHIHALASTANATATPTVLLPGLVTASRSMLPLARCLVRRGHRVLILDPPGFGYSDKPRRALAMPEQADLIAAWLQSSGLHGARVLGNSFGAQLAAAVTARHPHAASRLVLLAPTAGPSIRRRMAWLRLLPGPSEALSGTSGKRRIELLTHIHRLCGDNPPLRLLNVAEYATASLPRALSAVRCAVLDQIETVLPDIQVPTLMIRADRDQLSSLAWAQELAATLPDGHLIALPHADHTAFFTQPERVASLAGAFLEGH